MKGWMTPDVERGLSRPRDSVDKQKALRVAQAAGVATRWNKKTGQHEIDKVPAPRAKWGAAADRAANRVLGDKAK